MDSSCAVSDSAQAVEQQVGLCLPNTPAKSLGFPARSVQATLLDVPSALLHREVLPLLSLPTWGALRLACRALHTLVAAAPDDCIHAAARHTLPSTHPVFKQHPGRCLALQTRVGSAIAAGPSAWQWKHVQHLPCLVERLDSSPSPDWSKLAVASGGRILVRNLLSGQQLLDLAPAKPSVAGNLAMGVTCCWTEDSLALFWVLNVDSRCIVGYRHLSSGLQSSVRLDIPCVTEPMRPAVLPGRHALLLPVQSQHGRAHFCVVQPGNRQLSAAACKVPLATSHCKCAFGASGKLAFTMGTAGPQLCIWNECVAVPAPTEPQVTHCTVQLPDQALALA